ncbi:hypothetical protein [Flavobacterium filum]|uniref:hypothetical protein n=1 Tax=Flavobacterium filum TaxID=370974 RepID=UPI0023F1A159|nr:hypothetical protein [Flavobacterium filum]
MQEIVKSCLFCGKSAKFRMFGNDFEEFDCPLCKKYIIKYDARINLPRMISDKYLEKRHLLSGIFRERYELLLYEEVITTDNFESMLHTVNVPVTLQERMDKIITYLYNKTKYYSERLDIYQPQDYSLGYAVNEDEFNHMLMELDLQRHLIDREQKHSTHYRLRLTSKGFERAEQLRTSPIISNQCFVAMWFSDEMNKVYSDYFVPAIEAKTLDGQNITDEKSYKSIKIDMKDFNDEIVDEIISEIRKSKFIVADFTGNRGGVYYEAGFAKGLGLEVIFCCKKDDFKNMHFDVNHKNYIVWETGEDLYNKLRKRISATII